MRRLKVTIEDVAKEAGVSPQTVSNYLHGERIKEKNREKIKKTIKELDYVPYSIARTLRTGKTSTIGFLLKLSYLKQPATFETIYGIKKRLDESGYNLDLICSEESSKFDDRLVDGLLIGPISEKIFKDIEKIKIPIIFLHKCDYADKKTYVTVDNKYGGKLAAEHLIKNNHKKIGILVNTSKINFDFKKRRDSFVKTIKVNGAALRLELEVPLDINKYKNWWDQNKSIIYNSKVTAIFGTTDILALHLMSFLNDDGIKVGEDLSIIGFDNTAGSKYSTPKLTTVSGEFEKTGYLGADNIINKIEKGKYKEKKIIIQPKLYIRNSVKYI